MTPLKHTDVNSVRFPIRKVDFIENISILVDLIDYKSIGKCLKFKEFAYIKSANLFDYYSWTENRTTFLK